MLIVFCVRIVRAPLETKLISYYCMRDAPGKSK